MFSSFENRINATQNCNWETESPRNMSRLMLMLVDWLVLLQWLRIRVFHLAMLPIKNVRMTGGNSYISRALSIWDTIKRCSVVYPCYNQGLHCTLETFCDHFIDELFKPYINTISFYNLFELVAGSSFAQGRHIFFQWV